MAADNAALHPGQTAQIKYQDKPLGWCGVLHPEIAQSLDIKADVMLFELVLGPLMLTKTQQYQAVSRLSFYPTRFVFIGATAAAVFRIRAAVIRTF